MGAIDLIQTSLCRIGEATLALVRIEGRKALWASSPIEGFVEGGGVENGVAYPLVVANAYRLRELLPWLQARRITGCTSFGFGDRLGNATPGHLCALATVPHVFPVLAQQSVRENARTNRDFAEVMAAAVFGAFEAGYRGGFGADADHLKSVDDALSAADEGYTLFTCDPGDHVPALDGLESSEIVRRFRSRPDAEDIRSSFLGRLVEVEGLVPFRLTEEDVARAAVKYGDAVQLAEKMYRALAVRCPNGFDFEMSVDETDSPTTPLEHVFVASELKRRDVTLWSLAPRFPGAMEKGVEWRGDFNHLQADMRSHAAIARAFGGYRLSLHSGSDKFSIYPLLAEATQGLCHVKTAGTSYLVALEVVANRAPEVFREILALSRERFGEEKASYHLSASLERAPSARSLLDHELLDLVAQHDARQILHVGYGAVLADPLGAKLDCVLREYEDEYYERLANHLGRHVRLLGGGVR